MKRVILGSVLAFAFLLVPGQALAQFGNGFFVGPALNVTVFSPEAIEDIDEDSDTETGYGLGAVAGFSFGAIAPYARGAYAIMSADDDSDSSDNPALLHLDLGARLGLPLGALVPYINAAYTFQQFRQDFQGETYTVSGNGFTGGLGIMLLFGNLALDAVLNVTSGNFTEASYGDMSQDLDVDNTTTRLDIGLTFITGGANE